MKFVSTNGLPWGQSERESEEAVEFVKVLKPWFCYQRPVIDLINHQLHIADQKVESNSNQNQLACKDVSCKIWTPGDKTTWFVIKFHKQEYNNL